VRVVIGEPRNRAFEVHFPTAIERRGAVVRITGLAE
jgi:hypothetical protein